jgi:hypothetical protein
MLGKIYIYHGRTIHKLRTIYMVRIRFLRLDIMQEMGHWRGSPMH